MSGLRERSIFRIEATKGNDLQNCLQRTILRIMETVDDEVKIGHEVPTKVQDWKSDQDVRNTVNLLQISLQRKRAAIASKVSS